MNTGSNRKGLRSDKVRGDFGPPRQSVEGPLGTRRLGDKDKDPSS